MLHKRFTKIADPHRLSTLQGRLYFTIKIQIFKECDVKSGRYVEHQCAFDQHFSAKHQKCVKGSECEASGDSGEGDGKNFYCVILGLKNDFRFFK